MVNRERLILQWSSQIDHIDGDAGASCVAVSGNWAVCDGYLLLQTKACLMASFPLHVVNRSRLDWVKQSWVPLVCFSVLSRQCRCCDELEEGLDALTDCLQFMKIALKSDRSSRSGESFCLAFSYLSYMITRNLAFSAAWSQTHCLLVCELGTESIATDVSTRGCVWPSHQWFVILADRVGLSPDKYDFVTSDESIDWWQ